MVTSADEEPTRASENCRATARPPPIWFSAKAQGPCLFPRTKGTSAIQWKTLHDDSL